jgi:hypothetical protein
MFSGDTLPPNSPNGGEYHTQMKLAAFLFFLHERFHHGSTPDPLLSSGFSLKEPPVAQPQSAR